MFKYILFKSILTIKKYIFILPMMEPKKSPACVPQSSLLTTRPRKIVGKLAENFQSNSYFSPQKCDVFECILIDR